MGEIRNAYKLCSENVHCRDHLGDLCAVRKIILKCMGSFERFGDWRPCAAFMKREAVTVMLSCSGGGNV